MSNTIYSLENKPAELVELRKTATIRAQFVSEPFVVETQEGPMTISPETVDDWEDGYYVAYPSDGTKPYSISPKFIRENYTPV